MDKYDFTIKILDDLIRRLKGKSKEKKVVTFDSFVEDKKSKEETKNSRKVVITERDILNYKDVVLHIPKNSIITPLALDCAKSKGIKIIKGD
ncbi:hypothetical protein SAMN05660865_00228 [Caloramator fervidus]|uniref:Uncharacterized protein n=1 Tax=Caloramator fervidus TaxID=29344 RepID=A0A1H5RVQ0_9CLOT|nr:hypothetical protein [Caloramator fervidus]SEF42330.1 hypothetical protein SAMN05660865_00228 [Caloramator fervidus]